MQALVIALSIFAALGIFFGLLLALSSRVFRVKVDEKEEAVLSALPGANCGGCGFPGCSELAKAICRGEASPSACVALDDEGAKKISEATGVPLSGQTRRMRAEVMCSGTVNLAKKRYAYSGASDCRAAARLGGGDKACLNGCLGFGSCVSACRFSAIKVKDGLARIDCDKCVGCGACVSACPKGIIRLIPYDAVCWVSCMSVNDGKTTNSCCRVGCISCRICEKNCPSGAITVNNFVASIDYEKCTGCGICTTKCPRHIISFAPGGDPSSALRPSART